MGGKAKNSKTSTPKTPHQNGGVKNAHTKEEPQIVVPPTPLPVQTPQAVASTTPPFFFVSVAIIAVLTLFAVVMNSTYSPVLVRMMAPDGTCTTCQTMMGKISLEMELRKSVLGRENRTATNKGDRGARRAAADIIQHACDWEKGSSLRSDKKDKDAASKNAAEQISKNATTCAEMVASQKKPLLRYILNVSRSAGTSLGSAEKKTKEKDSNDKLKKKKQSTGAVVLPPTPSELCYEYCEARMNVFVRALFTLLRMPSHPSVVGARNLVQNFWGTVLLLAVIGVLLGTILQARVRASRLRYAAALKRRRIQQWREGKIVPLHNPSAEAALVGALASDLSAARV